MSVWATLNVLPESCHRFICVEASLASQPLHLEEEGSGDTVTHFVALRCNVSVPIRSFQSHGSNHMNAFFTWKSVMYEEKMERKKPDNAVIAFRSATKCVTVSPDPSSSKRRGWLVRLCGSKLVIDYYSRYIEIAKLDSLTSEGVITDLKSIFARHGIPHTFVSDNGPQYSSSSFATFADQYGFCHITKPKNSLNFIQEKMYGFLIKEQKERF